MNASDILSAIMYGLDTPGAYARGLLSGRGWKRTSGREFLESFGMDHPGMIPSIAAEIVVDPLTWIPLGWLKRLGSLKKLAKLKNVERAKAIEAGAISEEALARMAAKDEATGIPLTLYRGTYDLRQHPGYVVHEAPFVGREGIPLFPKQEMAMRYVNPPFGVKPKPGAIAGTSSHFYVGDDPFIVNLPIEKWKQEYPFLAKSPSLAELMSQWAEQGPRSLLDESIKVYEHTPPGLYSGSQMGKLLSAAAKVSYEQGRPLIGAQILEKMKPLPGLEGNVYAGDDFLRALRSVLGSDEAVGQALKRAGFDAIRYTPGPTQGVPNALNEFWIALQPWWLKKAIYAPPEAIPPNPVYSRIAQALLAGQGGLNVAEGLDKFGE